MKPVMQTVLGRDGNCFAACIASLFHMSIEEVPNFVGETVGDDWVSPVRAWLRTRGYGFFTIGLNGDPSMLKELEGYVIVAGESERGLCHATIWKAGTLVHDPHPSQCGILEPQYVDVVYPLLPAALAPVLAAPVALPVDTLQERYEFVLAACRDAQEVASGYGWALGQIAQGRQHPITFARDALLGRELPPAGAPFGIVDPDYARVFTQARIIAWQYGYACVMHGSFTRDLDLLLTPWEDRAYDNRVQLLKLIPAACGLRFRDGKGNIYESVPDFTQMPHGRTSCSLFFRDPADRRWVDIGFTPCVPKGSGSGNAEYDSWVPAGAPPCDGTEQALGLYVAQAEAIRELLDKHAPHTTGNLQARVAVALGVASSAKAQGENHG